MQMIERDYVECIHRTQLTCGSSDINPGPPPGTGTVASHRSPDHTTKPDYLNSTIMRFFQAAISFLLLGLVAAGPTGCTNQCVPFPQITNIAGWLTMTSSALILTMGSGTTAIARATVGHTRSNLSAPSRLKKTLQGNAMVFPARPAVTRHRTFLLAAPNVLEELGGIALGQRPTFSR